MEFRTCRYPADKQASAEIDTSEYKTVPKEKEAQFGEIGGASAKLQITTDSTEEDLVKAMHSMTHQKVIAEHKNGKQSRFSKMLKSQEVS